MRRSPVFHTLRWTPLLVAVACGRVTPEAIQSWKTAPDGADRLAAAVKDGKAGPDLRAQAAAALVEIGGVDRMEAVVAGLPIDERIQVIAPLVPRLAELTRASEAMRAGDARDGLYCLRQQATTDEAKKAVDAVLFPALELDLRADRLRVGRRSVHEMLVSLGPSSVPTLQRVLEDAQAPFAATVDVLEKVGDGEARGKGGAALVTRARAQRPAPAPLLEAIARLGGKDAVAFLTELVTGAPAEEAERAAVAMKKLRRDPEALAFALKTAGAAGTVAAIREHMFGVVEGMGGEDARKGLVELIGPAPDPAIRYRAFQAALKVGRGQAVLPALEALPLGAAYSPEEVADRVVKPIAEMPGFDSREGLFKAMESKSPLARLVAILALEKQGFAEDAEHIGKLSKHKDTLKGFPRGWTVGKEAERVVSVLKKPST